MTPGSLNFFTREIKKAFGAGGPAIAISAAIKIFVHIMMFPGKRQTLWGYA